MPGTITLITDFGLEDGHVGAMIGNLTTNLPANRLASSSTWEIEVAGQRISGLQRTFGDVAENQLMAFIDSEGFLTIAVRNGNAARKLGTREGDQVLLRRHCCADSY